jgi:hypothetical protein
LTVNSTRIYNLEYADKINLTLTTTERRDRKPIIWYFILALYISGVKISDLSHYLVDGRFNKGENSAIFSIILNIIEQPFPIIPTTSIFLPNTKGAIYKPEVHIPMINLSVQKTQNDDAQASGIADINNKQVDRNIVFFLPTLK